MVGQAGDAKGHKTLLRFSWLKRLLGEPLSSREIFGGKQDKYTAKRSHSLGNALSVRRIPSLGLEPLEPRHLLLAKCRIMPLS